MKVIVVWTFLGFCEGLIVSDWLRVRFEGEKPAKAVKNHSQRKLHAKANKAVANLK